MNKNGNIAEKLLKKLILIGVILISWGISCVIIKLITLVFGLEFDLIIATIIWLAIWNIKYLLRR